MPTQVVSAWRRLTATVGSFTIAQRTIALIGVAVLVLGIAALGSWMSRPTLTPLFSGLEAADANAIVEQLRTDGVSYELSEGGSTILVPEESVYDQRLKAAANGLPGSSSGGYSLLDDMGVTSSEFQQSVTYKRALEGELASTISALEGVKTASVRLAIPEESVFVSERNDPTASVFVETASGVTLTTEQVQAVVHLTSASIDGMKPDGVAVIDSEGTVLSAVGVGVGGSASDRATEYEDRVRSAVQAMLDQVVGPGNSSVVVAADVNQESAERVEETFTTDEDAPALNESVDRETFTGTDGAAAGVLGPDNIAVPDGENGEGAFVSESTVRNNAVNKVTESRIIPAGAIDRQTVSVAINGAAAGGLDVTEISALVTAAAGINENRGDAVTVEIVNFNQAGAIEAAEALAAAEQAAADERFHGLLRTAIITLGLIVPFILGLIVYARRSRRQAREPVDIDHLTEIMTAPTVPISRIPSLELSGQPIGTGLTDMDQKRADIRSLAETDPEKTAEYLRGLMDDRQPA